MKKLALRPIMRFSLFKNKSSDEEITKPLLTLESSSSQNSSDTIFSQRLDDVRVFTFSELKKATKKFSHKFLIKSNVCGALYKGVVPCTKDPGEYINVAVRQLDEMELKFFLVCNEWEKEINVLKHQHPNVVKLVGYCAEDDKQRLLVYEYIPRNLQDHLSNRYQRPLTWVTRLKIAQDVARGLLYLNDVMDPLVIYNIFKSSNILLDDQWNAKLDIGLAAHGDLNKLFYTTVLSYSEAPEICSGVLTCKSIIWSYGVFLYELITGRNASNGNRPIEERNILLWVRAHLSNIEMFPMILDKRLQGNYSLKAALEIAVIIENCLLEDQRARPKISEVLRRIDYICCGGE